MTEQQRDPIKLASHLARSGAFLRLYDEGMALVEEAAAYLDSEGRLCEQKLSVPQKALYASLSMQLTTRLMHTASWLLLQRAFNGGEMDRDQVLEERQKLRLDEGEDAEKLPPCESLPSALISLVDRSRRLQARVLKLDREIYPEAREDTGEAVHLENGVTTQLKLLKTAFGQI